MALCEMRIFSESLRMQTTVNVVIPQKSTNGEIGVSQNTQKGKYKCLYLLHGLSDDHSIWLRRTSVERYAAEYGICVIMPSGGRSFYTDMKYGEKYYTYIAEELPCIMQDLFGVSLDRCDNFIAGLSMGGYGALKIAMKNPERFGAAAGISSVADILGTKELFKDVFVPIFGEDIDISDSENLLKIAEEADKNEQKPRIYMGVGTEDFLYEGNQKLRKKFDSLSFDFTYRESEGGHTWEFWDEYIQYVLKWMFEK